LFEDLLLSEALLKNATLGCYVKTWLHHYLDHVQQNTDNNI